MDLLKAVARAIAPLACAFCVGVAAQGISEPAVKAAFLYKFAGYVEWPTPPRPEAPFVIGTLAADDVAAELARILPGRAISGRPAVVRTLREGQSLEGIHILFIGRRAADAAAAVRAGQRLGALTVTEGGLDAGGVINFVVEENRVAFEVSLEAAERSGHRISSRMLAVARRVVPKGAA